MRMLFEVLAGETGHREFANRKTGEIERTAYLQLHGVDHDFPDSMYKIMVWREFDRIEDCTIRGTVLQLKFNNIKPADGRFEKNPVINMNQDNIKVEKTAEQALKDLHERISNGKAAKQDSAPVAA